MLPAGLTFYDRLAAEYDLFGPPVFARFATHLAAGLEPNRRLGGPAAGDMCLDILDLATGAGAALFAAAESLEGSGFGTGRLLGADLSVAMVRRCRDEMTRRAQDGEVLRMDAGRLALADQSFDIALCAFAMDLFAAPGLVLGEAYRVLRPGGLIGLTVWSPSCPYFTWLERSLEIFLRRRAFGSGASLGNGASSNGEKAVISGLGEAGFEAWEIEDLVEVMRYPNKDEWWRSLWGSAFRATLESLGALEGALFKAFLFERVEELGRDGRLEAQLEARRIIALRPV